jgi:hypothetical protein
VNYKRIAYWTMITMLIIFSIKAAIAYPSSPQSITVDQSGRYNQTDQGYEIQAQAGNVTALTFYSERSTLFWQGYYGNITGRIVLDDASNDTMFAWDLATPSGELYATNSSGAVLWDNLTCVNFTADLSDNHRINLSTLSIQYNMNTTADPIANMSTDGFNSTFNSTFESILTVGGNRLGDDDTDSENCPMLHTFVDNIWQSSNFTELMTFDNDSALVFVTFIENSLSGYGTGSDDQHDFQIMVPEDGTPGKESSTTSYYFYVELQ